MDETSLSSPERISSSGPRQFVWVESHTERDGQPQVKLVPTVIAFVPTVQTLLVVQQLAGEPDGCVLSFFFSYLLHCHELPEVFTLYGCQDDCGVVEEQVFVNVAHPSSVPESFSRKAAGVSGLQSPIWSANAFTFIARLMFQQGEDFFIIGIPTILRLLGRVF